MTVHCPFCHSAEEARVQATDGAGGEFLLVMFSCPFFHRFSTKETGSDSQMQYVLDIWRKEKGDSWLQSIGPVLRERELKNIERSKLSANN